MRLRSLAAALFAALASLSCASAQGDGSAAPLTPVFTNFTYFDHHWIQWLPDHPVYEAIEAQVYEGPAERRFIRVFLTERAPPKRQVYFFSDAETAARWQAGRAFAREITLEDEANAGGARALRLRLADADGAPLEWRMEFGASDALQSYGAGLRPSRGHAADTAYIFHYFGRSAVARSARLALGGQNYDYVRDEADLMRRGPKTGYTAGSFTPVVRLGAFACAPERAALRCDQGRVFAPTTEAGEVWRTAPFGYAGLNHIDLHLSGDALDSYVHRFGAHVFRFDFEPALPPLPRLRGGESFAYAVSLDDAAGVVTGRIAAARDGDTVTLSWAPQTPPIMVSQPMTSVLVTQGEGYALSLRAD
jgi:hypothetical protein